MTVHAYVEGLSVNNPVTPKPTCWTSASTPNQLTLTSLHRTTPHCAATSHGSALNGEECRSTRDLDRSGVRLAETVIQTK